MAVSRSESVEALKQQATDFDAPYAAPGTCMGAKLRQGRLRYLHVSRSEEIDICVGDNVSAAEPLQFHETLEVRLVTQGKARIRRLGSQRTIEAGTTVLVLPRELHAIDGTQFGEYSFFALYIHPAVLNRRKVPSFDPRSSIGVPGAPIADPALSLLLMTAHQTWANGAAAWEKHAALNSLIDRLACCDLGLEIRSRDLAGPYAPAIDRALTHLREHYAGEVSLSELASVAKLSRFHFLRMFSAALGVTPRQFQLLLRVAHAKVLLRSKREIAEVALLTGFFDQSHLTRCFHHIVGVTPGDYRLGLALPADHVGATSCKTRRVLPAKNRAGNREMLE